TISASVSRSSFDPNQYSTDGGLVPARSATSTMRVEASPRSAITWAAAARIWGLRMWSIWGRGLTARGLSSMAGENLTRESTYTPELAETSAGTSNARVRKAPGCTRGAGGAFWTHRVQK